MLKKSKGFTLLEILIVLVILAVLAGLAVPAYQTAVEKSRKQEALATLGAIRSSQSRFWATSNAYTNNMALLDFDPNNVPAGSIAHYTYNMVAGGGGAFTAQATRNAVDLPAGVPANYTIRINEAGTITSQY